MNKRTNVLVLSTLLACAGMLAAPAAESPAIHPAIQAAVDSPERPAADRQSDESRHYAELFEFFGVRPGMTVLELFAAGGNTAEVLSRIVGPTGKVYLHNPPWYYEHAGRKDVDARLANKRLPNVVRLDRPLDRLKLEPDSLDGAVAFLVLHDFFWLTPDVPAVLAEIHAALKPGGWFAVVDHSAPPGTGAEQAKDRERGTHRIDEQYVKKICAEAGFVLDGENDVLRNPEDERTHPFFAPEMRGRHTDRFVLKFKKK